ncbi:MAG: hypothetical protein RMK57_14305 [Bryobacterales bacterium]|nr:hypothetical protein [Bryobacteraceae bacterium]MDW8355693.1 hypothetical protein [Bryobacterales bacterium]
MTVACTAFALLSACWTSPGAVAPRQQEDQPADPVKVSIEQLEREPHKFRDRTVRVRGRLENEGRNYFTDLRLVLKDEAGRRVPVRPWLPLSLPPRPPGASGPAPAVLSDFLGKDVELVAQWRKGMLRGFGEVWHLEVASANAR